MVVIAGTQVGVYRVLQQIGEGGMGTVWLAEHVTLGRRVAIKSLLPEYSTKPEVVQRFFNEARAATAITDPGIVQVHDFGTHTDGSAYIVMELLDGEPLDQRLARLGRLAIPDALRIMRQVASTLGAAHARGIVHRDIKPENIFLVRDPEVVAGERAKILDFGIAKLTGDNAGLKTQTSAVMGTPTYMSPEQCRGAGQVDQRSDVYALGCVLFALIVGQPPFVAAGGGELIAMHLREPAPVPSSRLPGIPPEIDRLILSCLAKDPAQRPASAGDVAIAIGALLGTGRESARHFPAEAVAAQPTKLMPTTLSAATGAMGTKRTGSRSRVLAIASVATIGVAGGAIALVVSSRGPEPASPEPAVTAHAPVPVAAPPPPLPAAKPDDEATVTAKHVVALAAGFVEWTKTHAGAPCPSVDEVADPPARRDGWGHAMALTCTDQPGDQIVGVRSAGPDGQMNTADDVTSWSLGHDVTSIVAGARWQVASSPAAKPAHPVATKRPSASPAKPKQPAVELDENGMPISR
ncbi:MAG TPA: serine/threonine-protein kinase [Kofleriaceae bacterium]|nr:serine/threonine-protein kinase [Kofleriaceae bacterium]